MWAQNARLGRVGCFLTPQFFHLPRPTPATSVWGWEHHKLLQGTQSLGY